MRETWDGKDRVDALHATRARPRWCGRWSIPQGKIALDVDPRNNAWIEETGFAERAATKWAARWMFWLQNLLELHTAARVAR